MFYFVLHEGASTVPITPDFVQGIATLCRLHSVEYEELVGLLQRTVCASSTRPTPPSAQAPAPMPDAEPHVARWLDEYKPVRPKRLRDDGWTALRQRQFLACLARGGSLEEAAALVGLGISAAYKLRRKPEGKRFAAAWDEALDLAARAQEAAPASYKDPCEAPNAHKGGRIEPRRFDSGPVAPQRSANVHSRPQWG